MGIIGTRRSRHRPRGSIVAVVDVGTTKIACFIARVEDGDELRIIGVGHQSSLGLKAGTIVDMASATTAIGNAVNAAEQMCGETIQEVLINLSAGHIESHGVTIEVTIAGHQVGDLDLRRALAHARGVERQGETELLHAIPTGYAIDGNRGIEDPRGMFGQALGVQLHAVTANIGAIKNLTSCFADTHLAVDGCCVSPYASGLSVLVDDEKELGATIVDMGGGTTEIAVFLDGVLVHADCVPVGGAHVTSDVARGLTTPLAHAERIKTLHGSCMPTSTDDQALIDVPQVGEYGEGEPVQANHLPRSYLVGIIQPRIEETFELVRQHLEASGFYQVAGRRVVLTGGAAQLSGVRELAQMVLDKQVRIGKPRRLAGQPEAVSGPAFATAVGLLAFAQHPVEDLSGLTATPQSATGPFGRFGAWLRENL
jgi:cell division protein FtsA